MQKARPGLLARTSSSVAKNQVFDADELEQCRHFFSTKQKRTSSHCKGIEPVLNKLDFFREKPTEIRHKAIKQCALVSLKAGEKVFAKGDVADKVYVILSGVCTVLLEKSRAKKAVAATSKKDGTGTGAIARNNSSRTDLTNVCKDVQEESVEEIGATKVAEMDQVTLLPTPIVEPVTTTPPSTGVNQHSHPESSTLNSIVDDTATTVKTGSESNGELTLPVQTSGTSKLESTDSVNGALKVGGQKVVPGCLQVLAESSDSCEQTEMTSPAPSPKSRRRPNRTRGSVMLMRSPSVNQLLGGGDPKTARKASRVIRPPIDQAAQVVENTIEQNQDDAEDQEEEKEENGESNVERVPLYPGKVFGESSVFGSGNEQALRSATVEVAKDADLLVFNSTEYSKLVDIALKQQTVLKVQTLKDSEIFKGYTETQLYSLSYSFDLVSYGDGDVVCHEGDQATNTFMIAQGQCHVLRKVEREMPAVHLGKGSRVKLFDFVPVTSIGPGGIFGTSDLDSSVAYKFSLIACSSVVQVLVIKANVFRTQLHRWVRSRMVQDDKDRTVLRESRCTFVDQFSGKIMEARQLAQVVQMDTKVLANPSTSYAPSSERYPSLARNQYFRPKSPSSKIRAEAGVGGGELYVDRITKQAVSIASADTLGLMNDAHLRGVASVYSSGSSTMTKSSTPQSARVISPSPTTNSRALRSSAEIPRCSATKLPRPSSAPVGPSQFGKAEVELVLQQVRRMEESRRRSIDLTRKFSHVSKKQPPELDIPRRSKPECNASNRILTRLNSSNTPKRERLVDLQATVQSPQNRCETESKSILMYPKRNLRRSMLGKLQNQTPGILVLEPPIVYCPKSESYSETLPTQQLGHLLRENQRDLSTGDTQLKPSCLSDMPSYFAKTPSNSLPDSASHRTQTRSSASSRKSTILWNRMMNNRLRPETAPVVPRIQTSKKVGMQTSFTGFNFESERELMEFTVRVLNPNILRGPSISQHTALRNNLPIARDTVTSHVDLLLGPIARHKSRHRGKLLAQQSMSFKNLRRSSVASATSRKGNNSNKRDRSFMTEVVTKRRSSNTKNRLRRSSRSR